MKITARPAANLFHSTPYVFDLTIEDWGITIRSCVAVFDAHRQLAMVTLPSGTSGPYLCTHVEFTSGLCFSSFQRAAKEAIRQAISLPREATA